MLTQGIHLRSHSLAKLEEKIKTKERSHTKAYEVSNAKVNELTNTKTHQKNFFEAFFLR